MLTFHNFLPLFGVNNVNLTRFLHIVWYASFLRFTITFEQLLHNNQLDNSYHTIGVT